MERIILHLDMNSYFASVEQQANPLLRGRPVGVCEHLGGLIIAPSVEAKRLGVRLGMPVWKALKICPGIVFLPTDPSKYRAVTERFNHILSDYSADIQRYSIDESFADITEVCGGDFSEALIVALTIKQRLRREVGQWMSCSIGVGSNKLVSKIAADLGEGDIDRVCVVHPEEVSGLYDRLDLTDVPGIGKRLESALHGLGVFTLRQLRDFPEENLINRFGIWGWVLGRLANFEDVAEASVSDHVSPKSVGHMYTVPRTISHPNDVRGLMMKLSEKVGRRLRKNRGWGRVVHYFHSGFHHQRTLREPVSDGREIYRVAWKIFLSCPRPPAIKIMGITVSGLNFFPRPEPLFAACKKILWAVSAADEINNKYGEWTIYPGRLLGMPDEWGQDTVGFSRIRS